jgi:hypothetical protein
MTRTWALGTSCENPIVRRSRCALLVVPSERDRVAFDIDMGANAQARNVMRR